MSTVNTTNLKNPSSGSNNIVLDAAGGATFQQIKGGALTLATAVASTSGTSIDFTGIPSWVKRVTVMFSGVSTNGTSVPLIQLGDAGGIETTGYLGTSSVITSAVASSNGTTGYLLGAANWGATVVSHGSIIISLCGSNTWVASGSIGDSTTAITYTTSGSKTLSGTLDRIRITTANGTDTFDAGTINILYEG